MSTGLLETCRELKYIYRKELCLKLAIYQETTFLFGAGSTERYETSWFSLHKQDCSFHSALKVINHFSKNLLLSSWTTWRIPVQNFTQICQEIWKLLLHIHSEHYVNHDSHRASFHAIGLFLSTSCKNSLCRNSWKLMSLIQHQGQRSRQTDWRNLSFLMSFLFFVS